MPLLLIDYIFDQNKEIYSIIGDEFLGCMRNIDKERGNNILLNDIGYKIKFRCSPVSEIEENKFKQILKIIENDKKPFINLI